MTEPIKLRSRHAINVKEATKLNAEIEALWGIRPLPREGDELVEKARSDDFEFVLVDGKACLVLSGLDRARPVPTVRALIANRPQRAWVTVDMGAIPYLRNGADVMSAGIEAADAGIQAGDLVWVRDEKHGVPLAVGNALIAGAEMATATKGKAVKTLLYVGDLVWNIGTGTTD